MCVISTNKNWKEYLIITLIKMSDNNLTVIRRAKSLRNLVSTPVQDQLKIVWVLVVLKLNIKPF